MEAPLRRRRPAGRRLSEPATGRRGLGAAHEGYGFFPRCQYFPGLFSSGKIRELFPDFFSGKSGISRGNSGTSWPGEQSSEKYFFFPLAKSFEEELYPIPTNVLFKKHASSPSPAKPSLPSPPCPPQWPHPLQPSPVCHLQPNVFFCTTVTSLGMQVVKVSPPEPIFSPFCQMGFDMVQQKEENVRIQSRNQGNFLQF